MSTLDLDAPISTPIRSASDVSRLINASGALSGGLLGMRLAYRLPSRRVAIAGFALQVAALVALALLGHPQTAPGIGAAVLMLGLWLFAEGFGPGAQMMIYPALPYPTSIRGTGLGFGRALTGIGSAFALFVLPILNARLGTSMFWIVSIAAFVPIVFLAAIRFEPTARDVDVDAGAHPEGDRTRVREAA
ncbi:putative ygcS [Burkholderia thailandensis MSMB121]|nr:putative ygcS [Burkholderia thailandensis MSMB121]ATF32770.1 transporter [Burkholderia thailandensis]